MPVASYPRMALMVLGSLSLTLVLGFWLPRCLTFVAKLFGFTESTVTHSIVLLYFLLVLALALPPLPRGSLKAEGKAVLITGCDKGFGFALAKHLHDLGFTVFAGCLLKDENGDGARELKNVNSDRMKVVQLNVCSEEEVAQAVEFVRKSLKDPEKGRVINMASVLGRMGNPSRSSYCISKYGIEAFSDCLRYEMHHWGVKVIIIEPGNFIAATGIFTREGVQACADEMWNETSELVRQEYGKAYFDHQTNLMKSFCSSGLKDVTLVLNDITDALTSRYPFIRYNPTQAYWWVRLQIMTHLPAPISDQIYIY
nr:PREDICTED: D-beta-hydroxybutyrate dehydrogenase, mitochondrial-like isoform X3 [Latimeria chalumnae]|eukprot:XP_005989440.1 PREDICTED: D-beta-hydroxybutyrate dehydrogenase, mitochondrial-like isoform X3 [Latimeria chalumnae]